MAIHSMRCTAPLNLVQGCTFIAFDSRHAEPQGARTDSFPDQKFYLQAIRCGCTPRLLFSFHVLFYSYK